MNKLLNWSLPCKCGDCGGFQIIYQPLDSGKQHYRTYIRCRSCERTYENVEDLIEQRETG